jgi:hypothetical protein
LGDASPAGPDRVDPTTGQPPLTRDVDLDAEEVVIAVSDLLRRVEITPAEYVKDIVTREARKSAQFNQRAETTNLGPTTLDQLYSDVSRIVATYPGQPVLPLFQEAAELRDRAFALVEGHQQPWQTRELYLISGWLCGILANASLDLGHLAAAETQARTAWLCADLAGNNALRAWVRGMQGLVSYWSGRPEDAANDAASGWQFVPESGTARVRLACIEARAWAQAGNVDAATDALRRADAAREEVVNDDALGGMLAFPVAKQRFYASTANLWLGGRAHLLDAEREANESVFLYEADTAEHRRIGELSLARLDLATALLSRGELDGAGQQARLVLEAAAVRRTDSVTQRLRYLVGAASSLPCGEDRLAVDLCDEITTFLSAATAPRLLPPVAR